MSELTTDDDVQRWADARSVVEGLPTAEARRRNADSVLIQWSVGGLAAVVFVAVIAASVHHHFEIRLATTLTARVLGWVLIASGLALTVAGATWSRRRRRSQPPRSPLSPLASLTRRQRRWLRCAIRRDEAVPADRRDVVAYQADMWTRPGPTLLTTVGTLMIPWGQALSDRGVIPVWVSASTVLILGTTGPTIWNYYRARVWLAAHQGDRLHRVQ